jgi:hypothetical protein
MLLSQSRQSLYPMLIAISFFMSPVTAML